jgi:hypothetical protein
MRYSRLFARFIIIVVRRPTTTGGAASLVCRMMNFIRDIVVVVIARKKVARPSMRERGKERALLCVEGMNYHRRRYHCHDILPSRSKSGDSCVPPETKRIRMMPGDK